MTSMEESAKRGQVQHLLHDAVPDLEAFFRKAGRLVVAVRKHHRPFSSNEIVDLQDWVWVKAHGKVPISKIVDAYKNQCAVGDETDISLRMADSTTPTPATTMSALPTQDRLLVLTAAVREPDPPSSQAASSAAPSFNSAMSNSPRPPLHEVNRQLTAPSSRSPVPAMKLNAAAMSNQPAASYNAPPNHLDRVPHPSATSIKAEQSENVDPLPPTYRGHPLASPTSVTAGQAAIPAAQPKEEPEEETQAYAPREQDNPFAASQESEPEQHAPCGQFLQQLSNETTPERLEAGVAAGLKALSELELPLKELAANEDATNWLKQIDTVRKDAARTRTVIGVVGNTGAGKSSVINAMLEEERLVPTNCMRACTAVVTEMSYNDSPNPRMKYRAEIEFIRPEDWQKELHILYKEIIDESGNISREISNPESDAGVAYAKIRAVYHKLTKDDLTRTNPHALMTHKHVKNVLGQSRKIYESDASAFYKRLQQYVDSKEKGTEKLDKNGNVASNQGKRKFELWPLIKVVKIYTRADALSTGAVIVDLPGVHDMNAARAAVAEGYMKECTGLWILAPINRAVDDKAAKTLLGNTFKRQLKFDGTYNAVTFICSKTDDISRTEAFDSLGIDTTELDTKMDEIASQRREIKKQLRAAVEKKSNHDDAMEDIDDKIESWENLADEVGDGKTVYAPTNKKRKRSSAGGAKKRRRRAVDSDDDSDNKSDDAQSEAQPEEGLSSEPLTEEVVTAKLDELKQLKKDMRREKRTLDDRITELEDELDGLQVKEDEVDAELSARCIKGRNDYSRGAIQQDFAAGIRDLDQEAAADEDPDNFNPDEDIRDYDQVARGLSVFCVSSRAYQKLCGRLKKDNAVAGFTHKDVTEIPKLQAHCKALTVGGRNAGCRRFLNSLTSLITSLALWASDDGTGVKLTSQQRDAEKAFLSRKLKDLEKALDKVVTVTLEDVVENLHEQLFDKMDPAVQSAVDGAQATSAGWGAHKNDGGLHYMTYKATVRRDGVYAGAKGHRDFNSELTEPLLKQLASAWEKAFQRRLPHILQTFKRSATTVLKQFHSAVEARTREKGHGLARIAMLGTQLDAYSAIFGDLAQAAVDSITEGQREINREFTPAIAQAMNPAYEYCTNEAGRGSYARMKAGMAAHVETEKSLMFDSAAKGVRQSLLTLCESVKKTMLDKADGVFVRMQKDYLTLVGVHKGDMKMSREERQLRLKVDEAIADLDGLFQDVLEAELDQLKEDHAAGNVKSETEGVDATRAEDEVTNDDEEDLDLDDTDSEGEGEDAASDAEDSDPPSPTNSNDPGDDQDI
ncbi:Nuclear GTPase SLIP-GC [Fulvia fulva]|nr:Nuclear GTPase SLIP-GC [Fulvia fulva]WPV08902.1 Nuclear GTPase SLIP-GC [Fulvia fulva]WPV24815.1 Nuclear GTPase SLIP-GC [Fulvia fulva]